MKKRIRFLTIVWLGSAPFLAFAAEPTPQPRPVPSSDVKDAEVTSALKAYAAAESKAWADYERARGIAQAAAVKRLRDRLDAMTKAGRLDDAVAVRDLITELTPKPTDKPTDKPADAVPFLPIADIIGTWTESNGAKYVLTRDGKFTYAGNQPGTWQITASSLVLTWTTRQGQANTGRVDTYDTIEGSVIKGNTSKGHKVEIKKQ